MHTTIERRSRAAEVKAMTARRGGGDGDGDGGDEMERTKSCDAGVQESSVTRSSVKRSDDAG